MGETLLYFLVSKARQQPAVLQNKSPATPTEHTLSLGSSKFRRAAGAQQLKDQQQQIE
jgi:hypothetical protein